MTDREQLARAPAHALDCIKAGIDAARPERAITDACSLDGDTLVVRGDRYDLSDYDRVLVVG